ncbi:MAG TPA: HAMP domain-containing sensor histidine kinase [Candidatus Acidoferrales bacterium]|nr:HAMP domain-containing sensor histidine kinase [Candidatus Acidoferrales bacterium]
MKIRLSLRNRIFLGLGGLTFAALSVVWIIIRPQYEKSVVAERITILQQLQSFEVQNIDSQIGAWITATKSVAAQLTDDPKGGEALLVDAITLFPNIVQIRVNSPGISEQINGQNVTYPSPAFQIADSMFVASSDPTVMLAWLTGLSGSPSEAFVTRTTFKVADRLFFVNIMWDAGILQRYLTRLPFGSTYFLGIFAGNRVVYKNRYDLRIIDTSFTYRRTYNLRLVRLREENWQTATSTFQNANMNVVVAVPEKTIIAPVNQLLIYSSTLIIAIMTALLVLGWFMSHQISKPIEMLVKDVERMEDLDFRQGVRIPALHDFHKMGETIESMRRSLERYQRLNVEKIILEEWKNKLLMNHSGDLIAIADGDGKLVFRNAKFNELCQLISLDGDVAMKDDVIHHARIKPLKETIQTEEAGSFTTYFVQSELKVEFENEVAQYYRVNDLTILRGAENLGSLIIFHDLTNDRLIDQMKTDMMNVIVHELRNRVTTISMLSTLLSREGAMEESKRRESLNIIAKSMQTLNDLINRFLNISRLESRRVDYTKTLSDIVTIVRDELEREMLQFQEKSLKSEFIVSDEIPLSVVVPELIHDAVANLLSNAIKYGGPDRTIEVNLSRMDNSILLSVTDHGYGISPEAQEKLFSKFYRVLTDEKVKDQVGTGLGLAYVKEIAAYHNGSVSLESNPEIGCRFTLTIPIVEGPAE